MKLSERRMLVVMLQDKYSGIANIRVQADGTVTGLLAGRNERTFLGYDTELIKEARILRRIQNENI